jgi:hypothetical protein
MSPNVRPLDADDHPLPESKRFRSRSPLHRSREEWPRGGARSAQINPLTMPWLFLRTSDRGSFAERTFQTRIPRIVNDALDREDLHREAREALVALRSEIEGGAVRALWEDAPDRALWDAMSAPLVGRSWFDAPYYLAESFFYRRVLEATGYHRPGRGFGIDPFIHRKEAELVVALREIEAFTAAAPSGRAERLERHLLASLWGNRADLCHHASQKLARQAPSRDDLVVDDTKVLRALFQGRPLDRLVVVTDNAATELVHDLLLVDFLLGEGLVRRVDLHVKPAPCFVSDVTMADIGLTLADLRSTPGAPAALGERLVGHFNGGRLSASAHWFYGSSLFFSDLPDDLAVNLAGADLVMLKGDLNYRRLLGDIKWPATTPFSVVTDYFPAPIAALRTMKAEVVVGLGAGQSESFAAADPDWMVNGRRAVLQVRASRSAGPATTRVSRGLAAR